MSEKLWTQADQDLLERVFFYPHMDALEIASALFAAVCEGVSGFVCKPYFSDPREVAAFLGSVAVWDDEWNNRYLIPLALDSVVIEAHKQHDMEGQFNYVIYRR